MKKLILSMAAIILVFGVCTAPALAANLGDAFGEPLENVAHDAGYDDDVQPEVLVGRVIRIALSFLGVIFFVLMLYGGFLWMTAAGNEDRVTKAKNLIIAAVTGMIIVLASYAISYFILRELSDQLLDETPSQVVPDDEIDFI
jgi:cbb3-type cytochrome oxidase subunit 3